MAVPPEESDVIMIGGGVAGLACAVGLLDMGLRLVLVESEKMLGGRARSWIDDTTGDPVHIGPHIVTSLHSSFLALLDRLGTADRVVWEPREALYTLYEGPVPIPIRRPNIELPPPLQLMFAIGSDPNLTLLDLASNFKAAVCVLGLDQDAVQLFDRLDGLSALRRLGVSRTMIERYWEFASTSILNVPLSKASAGVLFRGFREALIRDTARVGLPGCGLGDLFAPPANDAILRSGHAICLGSRVASIQTVGDRVTGVRLTSGQVIRAKYVVSTVPPQQLTRIVPDAFRSQAPFAALSWFTAVPYVSVYLWLDRAITSRRFWARQPTRDSLTCDWYDYANIYKNRSDRRALLGTNIIDHPNAHELSDSEIVARAHAELAENIPSAAPARILHSRVHRIDQAVVAPFPGFEHRRPGSLTPIRGLFLAGDWTDTGFPSSMESAAVSGLRVAELVSRAEGRPARLESDLPRPGLLARSMVGLARQIPVTRVLHHRAEARM